jgi:hypothetical protein
MLQQVMTMLQQVMTMLQQVVCRSYKQLLFSWLCVCVRVLDAGCKHACMQHSAARHLLHRVLGSLQPDACLPRRQEVA